MVDGVNGNWTAVYYEKPLGLIRPLGVLEGRAYAQLPGTKTNVTAIVGKLVRCDQPAVLIEAMQLTDDAGKPTGQWEVEAHNPTDQALAVNFTVPDAFDLIKARRHTAQIPARSSVKYTLQ